MTDTVQEWAAELAAERERKLEREELAHRKLLSDRELMTKALPRVWAALVADVKSRVDCLDEASGNCGLRIEGSAKRKRIALVSRRTGDELEVLVLHAETFDLHTRSGSYRLTVNLTGDLVWDALPNYGATRSEVIASLVVERAFRAV